MKVLIRTMLFLTLSGNLIGVAAQTAFSTVPYVCGFEDASENSQWTLYARLNAAGVSPFPSRWYIGTATAHSGAYSMYVSKDSITDTYADAGAGYIVTAFREFNLPAGTYDLAFDWKCAGSGSDDAFRVGWMPASLMPNTDRGATASLGSAFPNFVLNNPLYGSGVFSGSSAWKQFITTITIPEGNTENYRLVFVWKAQGNGVTNPGAGIDNINIAKKANPGECFAVPTNIQVGNGQVLSVGSSFQATWDGTATDYEIEYFSDNNPVVYTVNTTDDSLSITDPIPEGIYNFRFRSICNGDTSIFIEKSNILVYDASLHCVDYLTLTNENCWIGDVRTSPFEINQVVNNGYAANIGSEATDSRHTIHYVQGETDPNVSLLKTKPDGAIASVRVGNMANNYGAEAVEYQYTVDTENPGILLLKYAAVIEASHDNPSYDYASKVVFELLDASGNVLSQCTKDEFAYGVNVGGWATYRTPDSSIGAKENGVWKDWTTIGVNLNDYAGQTITIRIITGDCDASAHSAYAYFTLDCSDGKIQGDESCGVKPQRFEVDEGFAYKWYQKYDPNRTSVGDERVFYLTPQDTATYCVDMISLINPACYFTLEASALKILPQARTELKWNPENCVNKVEIINNSGVFGYYTDNNGIEQEVDLNRDCDSYVWDFGEYGIFTGKNPEPVIFPNTGDTITVKLTVGINDGACVDDTVFVLEVPAIETTYGQTDLYIRDIDLPYTYGDMVFTEAGTVTNDTVNFAGCDSVLVVNLKVLSTEFINEEDKILCEGNYVIFHGDTIRSTGIYRDTVRSIVLDYDSIVYSVNVIVNPLLSIVLNDNSLNTCAGETQMPLDYTVNSGRPNQAQVMFSPESLANGFENITYSVIESPLQLDIPANARAGIYNATLRISDDCGYQDIPFSFVVNYTKSIITQRWNDVLSVTNKNFNGGYEFSSYQWYKDGVELTGETGSYMYVPEGLDMSACYSVKLVQTGSTDTIVSCDYCPVFVAGDVSLSPTQVMVSAPVRIEVPESATVSVFNTQGIRVAAHPLQAGVNTVIAPVQQGIYLYKIMLSNGDEKTFRVNVR